MALLSTGGLFALADLEIKDAVAGGGDWFGFTGVDQLYRDPFHMGDEGRWLASAALWSAVTGGSTVGLTPPPDQFGSAGSRIYTDPAYRDSLAAFVDASLPQILTPVPEPASAVLLAVGGGVLLRRRVA